MNAAQIIPFQKPSQPTQEAGKSMYSNKFDQGYVMSSRLYREEVWPFLTDAARNVYVELENRINGYNKESDFVSWTQLQGGKHKDSRKLSLSTVKVGLAMLLANGVVSIVAVGKQGIKKYRLNEVSLVGKKVIKPNEKESSKYFGNRSTTETEALQKPKQNTSETGVPDTSETEDTIDSSIESLDNNNENKAPSDFVAQDRGALNFIEYHLEDPKLYTLKELAGTYRIKTDFLAQAKVSFPKLSEDILIEQINELCKWSGGQPARTSQKWMTTWLNWLKNYQPAKPKADKPKNIKKSNANLNVNDAWKNQPTHHAPVEDLHVDIPEDFV
ncbi:hypothetical protein ABEF83_08160 [Acinetobacter thermotolerans]|uniref:hypothetical protein n=1 Tax=Acinetobacter thermotolerans TaxID=3151487 RepID=UPI00325AB390